MEGYINKDNPKLASIVGHLQSTPPIDFNASLHSMAAKHHLSIHAIKYEGPKVGGGSGSFTGKYSGPGIGTGSYAKGSLPTVHITVKHFDFENVKAFAKSIPAQFPHVLKAEALDHGELSHPVGLNPAAVGKLSPY